MSYQSRTGGVLFAKNVDRVATFYSVVLGLTEANRADDHILLESHRPYRSLHAGQSELRQEQVAILDTT
jgi:hypothetical protein